MWRGLVTSKIARVKKRYHISREPCTHLPTERDLLIANTPLLFNNLGRRPRNFFSGKSLESCGLFLKTPNPGSLGKNNKILANNPPLLFNKKQQGRLFASNRSDTFRRTSLTKAHAPLRDAPPSGLHVDDAIESGKD